MWPEINQSKQQDPLFPKPCADKKFGSTQLQVTFQKAVMNAFAQWTHLN